MKKTLFLALVSLLVCSTVALASGSSGGGGPIPSGGTAVDPFQVTETMKCTITEIKEDGTIMVKDEKSGKVHPLAISYKTKLTAQSKKDFDGRRDLKASDLVAGHRLKVVTRQANGEVLRVRVLKG